MAHAEKSIVVRVPVRTAYREWTAWEELPAFLGGVNRVTAHDAQTQEWDVEIGGRPMQWETRVEARDERHVAWRTTGHPHAEGDVELKPVEGGQTLVTLRLVYDPDGEHDVEGAAGMVDRLVVDSLERFKLYAEQREQRRTGDDNAPPPRGAETVTGPEGELGASDDPDAGDLPYDDREHRHHHGDIPAPDGFESLLERVDDAEATRPIGADDMGKVFDPDAAGGPPEHEIDVNDEDNEAGWSRTRV